MRSCLQRGPVALRDECSHVARLAWVAVVLIRVLYLYMGAAGADGSGLFDEWVARWTHADAVMCWCLTWCVDAFEGAATCFGCLQLALCLERGTRLFPCTWP